jgi:hypothetical protein
MYRSPGRRIGAIAGGVLLILALLPASVATAVGPAHHLVFSQQPSNTAVNSSISPAVTVTIEDSSGTTVDTSSTVAIAIGSGTGGLHGSVSVTAVHGVATFSNLNIDTVGTGFTLTATDAPDGGLAVTSNTFNITAVAVVDHIAFGPLPGSTPAGATLSPAVTVVLQDSGGSPVTTATGSATVVITSGSGPAGAQLLGSHTATVVNGVATFSGLSIDTAGAYTLTATYGALHATSGTITITSTNHLVFTTQPVGGAAGAVWPNFQVAVEYPTNTVVSTDNSTTVSISIGTNPAGGTLSCTGGTSEVAVNGYATFTGCSINVASASYYTLYATSSPAWIAATSGAFYIGGTANHLAFTTQPGGGAAGAVWTVQPVVAVENASNTVISDNSTVYLSIATNPAGGTLSCTGGTSEVAVNGYAYFTGCSINLASASSYTLYATSSVGWTAATSYAFYIGGSANQLVFTTQPGGGAAGAVWSVQPVVAVENASNVVVSTDNSTVVYLSIATNPAGGTLSCTGGTSEVAVNGYAYFSGCSINLASASFYTLSATSSPAWTAATSGAFYIGGTANGATITLTTSAPTPPGAQNPVITWGQGFNLGIQFAASGSGKTVALQGTRDGITWTTITSLTMGSSGGTSYHYTPVTNLWYRAVFAGTSDLGAAMSNQVRTVVREIALLRPTNFGHVRTISRNTSVTFTTTVRPARPELAPAKVSFWFYRQSGGSWVLAAKRDVLIDAAGVARTTFTFTSSGEWYVRMAANPTPYNANSVMSPVELYSVL